MKKYILALFAASVLLLVPALAFASNDNYPKLYNFYCENTKYNLTEWRVDSEKELEYFKQFISGDINPIEFTGLVMSVQKPELYAGPPHLMKVVSTLFKWSLLCGPTGEFEPFVEGTSVNGEDRSSGGIRGSYNVPS